MASTHFGVKTYYRREEDGSLTLKLEGEIKDVPLFEQVCVLKEIDLHSKWAPFCSSSMTMADLGKLDTVGWILIGMPHFGIARDGCFRAIGCDNVAEDNSFILVGQGVADRKPDAPPPDKTYLIDDPVLDGLDIPPWPTRFGSNRMTIKKFQALISILSPSHARTLLIANIDPNIDFMPQSLLEFVMKHVAGVMLSKLQNAAKRATKNPVNNEHARKMRQEEEFYKGWLMPKFQAVCDQNGWTMPAVPAFELNEEQLRRDYRLAERKPTRKAASFAVDGHEPIVENMEMTAESMRRRHDSMMAGSPGGLSSSDDGGAGVGSPILDLMTETVSELSTRSGISSVWRNNPIAQYMREMEDRTQQRKNDKVRAARKMATDRLKPISLPEEKKERLSELKRAKARRLASRGATGRTAESSRDRSPGTRRTIERFFYGLHHYTMPIRLSAVAVLVALLFAMLHPPGQPGGPSQIPRWWLIPLQDAATIIFLVLCGIVHLVICDLALVCAFDSLDIGMKAGRQVKKYYSDNVRFASAVGSVAIVVFSIVKAATKVWVQAGLWSLLQCYRSLSHAFATMWDGISTATLHKLPLQPFEPVYDWLAFISAVFCGAVGSVSCAIWLPAKLALDYIVRSNFVGREIELIIRWSVSVVASPLSRMTRTVCDSMHSFEGVATITTWQDEAFDTARFLFSYSAVFLLTILVLFHFSARRSRMRLISDDEQSLGSSEEGISSSPSNTPSRQQRRIVHSPSSAMSSLSDVVIPEEAAGRSRSSNSSGSSNMKRRMLRFRRKKTQSMLAAEAGELDATQVPPTPERRPFRSRTGTA